jgi:hypothetical protein
VLSAYRVGNYIGVISKVLHGTRRARAGSDLRAYPAGKRSHCDVGDGAPDDMQPRLDGPHLAHNPVEFLPGNGPDPHTVNFTFASRSANSAPLQLNFSLGCLYRGEPNVR